MAIEKRSVFHLSHLLVESYGGRAVEHHTNLRDQCPEHFVGERSAKNATFLFVFRQTPVLQKVQIFINISTRLMPWSMSYSPQILLL